MECRLPIRHRRDEEIKSSAPRSRSPRTVRRGFYVLNCLGSAGGVMRVAAGRTFVAAPFVTLQTVFLQVYCSYA